jgi:hypothetical protein
MTKIVVVPVDSRLTLETEGFFVAVEEIAWIKVLVCHPDLLRISFTVAAG